MVCARSMAMLGAPQAIVSLLNLLVVIQGVRDAVP
jgi:hypothetical protein